MAQVINRVHEDMQAWVKMEEANKHLFSAGVMNGADFAKLRLDRLDDIASRMAYTTVEQERDTLKILAIERKQLIAVAYPKGQRLGKLGYLLLRPVKAMITRGQARRDEQQQLAGIAQAMENTGFEAYAQTVIKRIRQGERNFSLITNLDTQLNDQVHFNLHFSYDREQGHRFESFRASYRNSANPEQFRQQTFAVDDQPIWARKAGNLVSGRPVLEVYRKDGVDIERWIVLDRQADEQGNHRIKTIPTGQVSVRSNCEQLPFWQQLDSWDKIFAEGNLISGNRAMVTVPFQGKSIEVFIAMSSDLRSLELRDGKGMPLNPQQFSPQEKNVIHQQQGSQQIEAVKTSQQQSSQKASQVPRQKNRVKTPKHKRNKIPR